MTLKFHGDNTRELINVKPALKLEDNHSDFELDGPWLSKTETPLVLLPTKIKQNQTMKTNCVLCSKVYLCLKEFKRTIKKHWDESYSKALRAKYERVYWPASRYSLRQKRSSGGAAALCTIRSLLLVPTSLLVANAAIPTLPASCEYCGKATYPYFVFIFKLSNEESPRYTSYRWLVESDWGLHQ